MPTYTYECSECGRRVNELSSFEKIVENAPICCNKKMKHRIGSPATIFKGSGFYATDYKHKHVDNRHMTPEKAFDMQ